MLEDKTGEYREAQQEYQDIESKLKDLVEQNIKNNEFIIMSPKKMSKINLLNAQGRIAQLRNILEKEIKQRELRL